MRAILVRAALMLVTATVPGGAWAAAPAPVAEVSGTIFLPNGRPAGGVSLRAVGSITQLYPGHNSVPPGASFDGDLGVSLRTDPQGRYRVRLDPDKPDLQAHFTWPAGVAASWYMRLISSEGYGTLHVRIEPGQRQLTRDIRLVLGDRLSGRVVSAATGRPIAGATVYVVTDIGWPVDFLHVKSDARGRFVVPDQLPPREYQVGADAKEWALLATPISDTKPPKPGEKGRARQLTFRMVPRPFLVRVVVLQADGKPLRNETVQGWLTEASLGPAVGGGRIGPWPQPTDDRGGFTIRQGSGPDMDVNRPWALAYPYVTLYVEYGGRKSTSTRIDCVRPSTKPVVLKLK